MMTNLQYYYDKYKGVDSWISDCGVAWASKEEGGDARRDLSVFQLLYALLLPKVGGNFIIKVFSYNFDMQYLSLLNVARYKYDKMYYFRSSQNFWSPEVYIIGIGKHELTKHEETTLFSIATDLSKGIITYPIERINSEFGIEYIYNTQNIVDTFTKSIKFFAYLVKYPKVFEEHKEQIKKYIHMKNELWGKKYLK